MSKRFFAVLGLVALSVFLTGCHTGEVSYEQQKSKADALQKIANTSKVVHDRPQ